MGCLAEQNGLLPINANSSGSITMFAIRSFMISEASKAWSGCTLSRSASINKIGHPSPRLDNAHKCWFGCQATHVKVWPKRWPRIGAGKTAMPWWEEWTSGRVASVAGVDTRNVEKRKGRTEKRSKREKVEERKGDTKKVSDKQQQ